MTKRIGRYASTSIPAPVKIIVPAAIALLLTWFTFTLTIDVLGNSAKVEDILEARKAGRVETCKFIDSEHDRDRAQIVEGERRLYGEFAGILNLTPQQLMRAHELNKKRYDEVIDTRPTYCPPRTPIKPYPTIAELGG